MFSSLLVIALLFNFYSAYEFEVAGCDFNDTVPEPQFNQLIKNIQNAFSDHDKIDVLKRFVTNLTKGFGGSQVIRLVQLYTFSSTRVVAINVTKNWILGVNCTEVANLLSKVDFTGDMLEILSHIAGFINDIPSNNATIIKGFTFRKDEAMEILKNAKPRTCTWGNLDLARFAFVIDVSGSMNEKFNYMGSLLTRLQFVQMELENALKSNILPNQQFNIIQFSSSASAWKPGVVNATQDNILMAVEYGKKLRADGATYMAKAIALAMTDPKVLGVYFLSDGEPNDGSSSIVLAKKWGKPVHTIAFKAGSLASSFLLTLAKETGGRFRSIK